MSDERCGYCDEKFGHEPWCIVTKGVLEENARIVAIIESEIQLAKELKDMAEYDGNSALAIRYIVRENTLMRLLEKVTA